MAKPGSTGIRLVVDYGEPNKKTLNHSGSIPNMESTLENIASCRYKTKMDKMSGFWQVDLTPNAQKFLAFITPQRRVFKWKVIPSGVVNAPALFQELMNKILSILRRRPVVKELIWPGRPDGSTHQRCMPLNEHPRGPSNPHGRVLCSLPGEPHQNQAGEV